MCSRLFFFFSQITDFDECFFVNMISDLESQVEPLANNGFNRVGKVKNNCFPFLVKLFLIADDATLYIANLKDHREPVRSNP